LPVETGRVIKRKRVQLPSGGTVDIPVITQITFLDVVNQAQESEFHLENSAAAKRDVHVASITGNGAPTDETGSGGSASDTSQTLQVERIDVWRVLDVVQQGQETSFAPDSKTVKQAPVAPPYFATHEKTHVVKYVNSPDDGNWIKSELIDRWKYADTVEQGQETDYFLSNPPDNTGIAGLTLGTDSDGVPTVAVDPELPDITDSSSGVDPAWRLDPFQNIVDFSGAAQPFVVGSRGQQLGPASFFSSKDGITWKAFIDTFSVPGASYGDGTAAVVVGSKKAFLIAGTGEGRFGESVNAGLLMSSTDGGETWFDITPSIVASGGSFGDVFYDFTPKLGPPAFRLQFSPLNLSLGDPGPSWQFQSSYDELQTWVSEGSGTRPSFWGRNSANSDFASGIDHDGNKIFVSSFNSAIFLATDLGQGLPPTHPLAPNGDYPSPWIKVYAVPDDFTQLSRGVAASRGGKGFDNHLQPLTGTTFVCGGGLNHPADATNAWTNFGNANALVGAAALPGTGDPAYGLYGPPGPPTGVLLHIFTAGSPPFYYVGANAYGMYSADFKIVNPTPNPGTYFIDSATLEFWMYATTFSGEDVFDPLVFVSVGGYYWQVFNPGSPPQRPIIISVASGDPATIVLP
jgi:hypothetical protein